MNQWKELWVAYHVGATRIKIFKDLWIHSAVWDRFYTFFIGAVFLGSLYMHFVEQWFWLLPMVVTEILLLFKLLSIKDNLVLGEYGGTDNTQAPPSSDNYQSTRYLIFKNQLKEKHITKSHIDECFELIDSQIDIASTGSSTLKKSSTFSIGILAGILTALWKQLDLNSLLVIALSIIGFVILINMIASIFPSKVEKLKELKYFMLLYCRETS